MRSRLQPATWIGVTASIQALLSGLVFLGLLPGWQLSLSPVLHGTAATTAMVAARLRAGRWSVETDAALITALFVPVFGPGMAWTFPRTPEEASGTNAHAAFEQYEQATDVEATAYRPPIFTGDFDRDLSRELNAVSYVEVMRRGTLEQKRNLLRALGRLAQPRHLAMIRQCLLDDEQEIRLCAYAEVARLGREHEEGIADLKLACSGSPRATAAEDDPWVQLAAAQLDYAASGVLDVEMGRFYLMEAVKSAEAVLQEVPEHWRVALTKAKAYLGLAEHANAIATLDVLPAEDQERPDVILTRAEIAFDQRDFPTARDLAEQLRRQRLSLPEWLAALGRPPQSTLHVLWDS
ncbi:MAG: tetratricopeptide repeat protein [Planctomycetota bacterium]